MESPTVIVMRFPCRGGKDFSDNLAPNFYLGKVLDSCERRTTLETAMRPAASIGFLCAALLLRTVCSPAQTRVDPNYPIHDRNRPQPAVVDPGTASTQQTPGRAPADAVVLFDGRDLARWRQQDGSVARWKLGPGYFEVVPGSGYLYTREAFGDCQLHVEFAEPDPGKI